MALALIAAAPAAHAETPATDPLLAEADGHAVSSVALGVVAGFNVTDLSGSADLDVLGMESAPSLVGSEGGSVGGFAAFKLGDRLALRVEALLEQRGAAASGAIRVDETTSAPYSFDYKFLFVTVPVVVEWHIPYDGSISPYVFGGAKLGLNLDADISGEALVADMMGDPILIEDEEDIADASKFDVGAMVGVGVRYPLSRGALRFDLRFAHSFTKVLDDYESRPEQGISLTARKLRTRSMSVVVSYEL